MRTTRVFLALALVASGIVWSTAIAGPAAAVEPARPFDACTVTDDQLSDSIKGQYNDNHAMSISQLFECEYGGWYNYIDSRWEPGWATVTPSLDDFKWQAGENRKVTLTFAGGLLQAEGRNGTNAKVWWPPDFGAWDFIFRDRVSGTETWSSWRGCCSGPFTPFRLENGDCPEYGLEDVDSCTYDLVWDSALAPGGVYANREYEVLISVSYQTEGYYWDTFWNEWRYTVAVGGARVVSSFVARGANVVEPVQADFTSDEIESQRGTVHFDATASGGTAPLRYFWDFGDGSPVVEGIGTAVHSYDEPGTYTVTLTVRDAQNREEQVSHDVTISAPELSVAIGLPDKDGERFEPGERATVRVEVSAGEGLGDLKALEFDGDPLVLDPEGRFTIVSGPVVGPTAVEPFALAPGESRTFDYEIEAGDEVGNVVLRSSVNGTDAADRAVQADAELTIAVREPLLEVSLKAQLTGSDDPPANPLQFDMEEADDGAVPREVVVTVTVKNVSDDDVDSVTIPGELEMSSRSRTPPEPYPMVQLSEAVDRELGTLAPDEERTEEYRFEVRDDGRLRIRALVSYENPSGGPPATLIETGAVDIDAGPGALLYFEADVHGPPTRDTGETYRIVGKVANRSTTETVVLDPLFADLDGNAGGGTIVRAGTLAPIGACGVPFFAELAPGEEIEFHVDVSTQIGRGTRSTVRFEPGGSVEHEDGTSDDLTDDDIYVKDGEDGVRETVVSLDDSVPTPDGGNPITWVLNFSLGVADSVQGMAEGIKFLLDEWPRLLAEGVLHLPDAVSATGRLLRVALVTTEYMASGLVAIGLDPDEKAAYSREVAAYFDEAMLIEIGVTPDELAYKMSDFVDQLLVPSQTLLATGDYDGFARKLGTVITDIVGPEKVAKVYAAAFRVGSCLVAGASARVRGVMQLTEHLPKGPPGLKNLPQEISELRVGQELGLPTLRKAFGVADEMAQRVANFARENDLVISLRFRQPRSLYWLDPPNNAVLKPEAIKIKNVDRIDIDFLGYRDNDLASVVFKEPIDQATFEARLVGQPEEIQKLARARYNTRVKEWNGDFGANMRKYEQAGQVDVGFNYTGNGIGSDVRTGAVKYRQFEMREVTAPDGTSMKVIFMADDNGVMRRMTGDIDLVDVRKSNGLPLTPAERADFYEAMQPVIGLQHGETPTWVKGNDFLWEKKAELLADHVSTAGGEAVAQIGPGGVWRAAFIDPNLSYFDPNGYLTYIWWQGGYRSIDSAAYSIGARFTQGVSDFVQSIVDRPFVPPTGWKLPGRTGGASVSMSAGPSGLGASTGGIGSMASFPVPGLGKCTWRFLDRTDAMILSLNRSGELERWDGTAWQPADDLIAHCATRAARLSLLPQSGVRGGVGAGATALPVTPLADFAPGVDTEWFTPTMTLIIDPGGPNQEEVMVMGASDDTVTLAAPLGKDHAGDELVVAVTTSAGELPATGGSPDRSLTLGAVLLVLGLLLRGLTRRCRRAVTV